MESWLYMEPHVVCNDLSHAAASGDDFFELLLSFGASDVLPRSSHFGGRTIPESRSTYRGRSGLGFQKQVWAVACIADVIGFITKAYTVEGPFPRPFVGFGSGTSGCFRCQTCTTGWGPVSTHTLAPGRHGFTTSEIATLTTRP